MEWYFGSENDDFVVPKDQESFERIPSPGSWSQWGITAFGGGSDFPKKNFCAVDMNISGHEREHSNNSSMCLGLYSNSRLWTTVPHEQADYQFTEDDQARINQMDDIFFNSLLEEDLTSADNLNGSSRYSTESHNSTIPAGNILKDMMLESNYILSNAHSSKYLKTDALSASVDWENGEVSSTYPLEDSLNGHVREDTSLEETVLHELERVTAQFTEKTQICFRDALYRLAENSKQTGNSSEDGDIIMEPILTSDNETSRIGEREVTESKTNAIDRAIANLLFSNNMNFDDEDNETTEQLHYGSTQTRISCCPHLTNLAGDAEVPNVGQGNLTTTNSQPAC